MLFWTIAFAKRQYKVTQGVEAIHAGEVMILTGGEYSINNLN